MKKTEKPYLHKYSDTEWEFIYPEKICENSISEIYWNAVESLGYDDIYAEKIFKSLIKKNPYFLDAYNHLSIAFRNQKKNLESYLTAEKSYNIGKQLFPKEFKKKTDELIWSNLENRPFLRSCQIYGLECQYEKDYLKALKLYHEVLKLNKNDNQGIRYLILECFFALKDYNKIEKFITKYSEDWSIEFSYGELIIHILKNNKDISSVYKKALEINRFLPAEIIKTKHTAPPPHRIPGEPNFDAGTPVGSIQEAYEYWERNKTIYKQKKIIEFFKKMNNTCT